MKHVSTRTSLRASACRPALSATLLSCVAGVAFTLGTMQPALASAELAKAKNCMACHAINNKVVGPGYKDIAKRYAAQPDATEKLVQKVLKGGAGAWGVVPMPANAQVSEAEARTLVQWILSLKS